MADTSAILIPRAVIALAPTLTELIKAACTQDPTHLGQTLPIEINRRRITELVEKAKGVLDNGNDVNLGSLKNLATRLTEAELIGDYINFIFKNKFEGRIKWKDIQRQVDELLRTMDGLINELYGNQSRGHDIEGEMPPGNLRRCLLYLSCFPKGSVFNCKRITRLFVTHKFIADHSGEPLLQELANWLKMTDSSLDADGVPNHFLIGNNVEDQTKWPEWHSMYREAHIESMESIPHENSLSSLIFSGGSIHTLNLEKREFFLLKTLTLRNVTLENEIYLKKLSLLQYLDLKYTNVRGCDWLEGLEELQMLDLRSTPVEEVPERYLERLRKLQHLLLGYCPRKGNNRLAGAKLNTEKLMTANLKTLRAIRRPENINKGSRVCKVVDLSVTGLKTEQLKCFWNAAKTFENLTSLGVAMTKDSFITLEGCPDNLKDKLKRLRMEGQFSIFSTSSQPHSGFDRLCDFKGLVDLTLVSLKRLRMQRQVFSRLDKLCEFKSLVDLTLASHKPINFDRVPCLQNLLCLRLYGLRKKLICRIRIQGFESLKKLVIGDMEKVETIEIPSAVIEAIATLKICNLPKFRKLVCLDTQHPLLRRGESETKVRFKKVKSHKTIFLRGFDNEPVDKSPLLTIYHYDMNRQCYRELNNMTSS